MRNIFRTIWDRLPRFITSDFSRKLVALGLAVIVYMAVKDRINSNSEIRDIAVSFSIPSGFALIEEKTQTVTVSVHGSESRIRNLTRNDFSVKRLSIDGSKYEKGKPYLLSVTASDINAPIGVSVDVVTPAVLSVDIDRLETLSLPVKPVFSQQSPPPQGYAVKRAVVSPSEVMVTAPSLELEKITELKTEPVRLEGMMEPFDYYASVVLPNPRIKISPPRVLVKTEIVKDMETLTFSSIRPSVLYSGKTSELRAEIPPDFTVDVVVSGPKTLMEALKPEEVKVYADAGELDQPGIYNVDAACWLPRAELKVRSINPQSVKVKIVK